MMTLKYPLILLLMSVVSGCEEKKTYWIQDTQDGREFGPYEAGHQAHNQLAEWGETYGSPMDRYSIVFKYGDDRNLKSWKLRDGFQERPSEDDKSRYRPWIVYRYGEREEVDCNALSKLLLERTKTGIGQAGNKFTVYLGSKHDSMSRKKLCDVVDGISSKLPDGHPFIIHVETLQEAINRNQSSIEKQRQEVEIMKKIHIQ